MILTSDNDRKQNKLSNTSQSGPSDISNGLQAPPPYGTTITSDVPYQPQLVYVQGVQPERRQSAFGRFIKAFCIAVLIWIVVSYTIRAVVYGITGHGRGRSYIPSKGEFRINDCSSWSAPEPAYDAQYSFTSHASYNLPADSSSLFLLSRGKLANGNVKFVSQSDIKDVRVHVAILYNERYLLDDIETCRIERDGGVGVGVLTPSSPWPFPKVRFDVTVQFPLSSSNHPLEINEFKTDLPLFKHEIGNLAQTVFFQNIEISTSNAIVTAEALNAGRLIAETTNGAILGSYNTSNKLILRTSNNIIQVNAGLHNNDDEKRTELELRTSNGNIQSSVSLYGESTTGGDYSVLAKTSNSRLDLNFATAPPVSSLWLKATSSNSPATVQLHPTYQGTFDLKTGSHFATRLEADNNVEDPEGKGRARTVSYTYTRVRSGVLAGNIYWDEEHKELGKVQVETSNSHLIVKA